MAIVRVCALLILLLNYFGDCRKKDDASVIIIGAGAAGIAAATKLLQNGISNITILEAENRIGGRIYSVKFGTSYVDLGAEWCHGENDNIVYGLAKDLNLLQPTPEVYPMLYHSNLKPIDNSFRDELFETFYNIYNEDRRDANNSLGEYVEKKFRETANDLWGKDSDKISIALESIALFEKWVLSFEGAFSWNSIAAGSDFVESSGNQQLNWMGRGYKTILDVLMKKYPNSKESLPIDDKIILNKEVEQIIWNITVNDKEQVIVTCGDKSKFTADHVILTVSLGVLKNQHTSLIVPTLPKEKIHAIETLGFDAVFKVFFEFANPWWNNTFEGYTFVWCPHDLEKPDMFFEGPVKNGKSWITSILTIIPVASNENVLEAWFTGEFVPELEKCANETIVNGIMYLMSRFNVCDFRDLVRPQKIIREGWYSNPHFRGTYSYQTIESRANSQSEAVILSEPLLTKSEKPALLFAGEASHPTYFSTVHGAIETGFREANRILDVYK